MALSKLHYVYGLDTSCFYTDAEKDIETKIIRAKYLLKTLDEWIEKKKITAGFMYRNPVQKPRKHECQYTLRHKRRRDVLRHYINENKIILKSLLAENIPLTREVRPNTLTLRRQVSIFDSNLTRCFGLKERTLNEEIVIVQVYFFDVVKSILRNGFMMNGKKYVFFSASAGQIRTKKFVAVREDLLQKHWNTLTAGMTIEEINSKGGMNPSKFLAYTALTNSATDLWEEFDIDRCIVVDDFENDVQGFVDFMSDKDFSIERTQMDVPITHTDGCGMMLPSVSKKNFMLRMPYVKGLMGVFDYIKFIKHHNCSPIITDIYGKQHDIIDEDIRIILTKSQFKLWKMYENWDDYKSRFKKYGCTAGRCNIEEDYIPDAKINYQMIQTLYDLSDAEILSLAKRNDEDIINMCRDPNTMLKVFGADDNHPYKSGFQKCLNMYPELLSDPYTRTTLRDIKKCLECELWSGKFKLDCKYTFVLPDFYAVCENLFMGIENPKGLLADGEVSCRLFEDSKELDCLRSPHLFFEHSLRTNVTLGGNVNDNECVQDWFCTDAVYTSCHDLISKILQFDVDGDKLLLVDNKTINNAVKRLNGDMVPLYYYMAKAGTVEITPDNIYDGLIAAYTGGNIGEISNAITKIWNSGEINEEKLKVVKWLCMQNNFTIDYAKTLYKPEEPEWVHNTITRHTKAKVPAFFKYAKDKEDNQIEEINDSTVNRIFKLLPPTRYRLNFKTNLNSKFSYDMLLHNKNAKFNATIAERFVKLTSSLNFNQVGFEGGSNYHAVFDAVRDEMRKLPYSEEKIVDSLIVYLFSMKRNSRKRAFWTIYGDIVAENLHKNIDEKSAVCPACQQRFIKFREDQKYCSVACRRSAKDKHLICVDCGKEVITTGRANRKQRCDECAKLHKRELAKINYLKRKNSVKQDNSKKLQSC